MPFFAYQHNNIALGLTLGRCTSIANPNNFSILTAAQMVEHSFII